MTRRGRQNARGLATALGALLVLLAPALPAEGVSGPGSQEHQWDTEAGPGVELVMQQWGPRHPIPIGETFVWTGVAHSESSQIDDVNVSSIYPLAQGGCTLSDLMTDQVTDTFFEFNANVTMTGPVCALQWAASAGSFPIIGSPTIEAHGHMSWTVVAYSSVSQQQDPDRALTTFFLPLAILLGALLLAIATAAHWMAAFSGLGAISLITLDNPSFSWEIATALIVLAALLEFVAYRHREK